MTETQKPIKKIYAGRGISAAVWDNKESRTVSIQRSYKDDKGVWQNTNSFNADDLPFIEVAVRRAGEFLYSLKEQELQQQVEHQRL